MSAFRITGTLPGIAVMSLLLPGVTPGQALDARPPDFQQIIRTMGDRIGSLSSEAEALAFFSSTLAPALDLAPAADKTKQASPGTQSYAQAGGLLSAELAAWQLASELRDAADLEDPGRLTPVQSRVDRQRWLLDERRPALRRAAALLAVLTTPRVGSGDGASDTFESYASYLDRTYPDLAGSEQSWVSVAEAQGHEGITRRLQEPWRDQPVAAGQQAIASRYFDTRLRPILTASLAARAVRAEAEAERQAHHHWIRLRDWVDGHRQRKGLMRLCGTWQWTVHNHQNHQDHKMTISFPSPEVLESGQRDGFRPAQIVVHGDSVYLRWEFQGGVQEDSLLFGKEGQRLEGSFVNSAGAWGSITGKRLAPCEAQANR
jgi:hypothetical protein